MKAFLVVLLATAVLARPQGYGASAPAQSYGGSSYHHQSQPATSQAYSGGSQTYASQPVSYTAPSVTFNPPQIHYGQPSITYSTPNNVPVAMPAQQSYGGSSYGGAATSSGGYRR